MIPRLLKDVKGLTLYAIFKLHVRTYKKYLPYLYLFIMSLIALTLFTLFINPQNSFSMYVISISPVFLFLAFLFITLFFLFSYIFLNRRRGILVSAFITGVMLFRALGFREPLYNVLLLIILILVEIYFAKR